jgi:hypothetical protein
MTKEELELQALQELFDTQEQERLEEIKRRDILQQNQKVF